MSHSSSPSVSCKCQPLLGVTLDLCEEDRIRLSQMKSPRTFATQHQNDYKVHTDRAVDTNHNDDTQHYLNSCHGCRIMLRATLGQI